MPDSIFQFNTFQTRPILNLDVMVCGEIIVRFPDLARHQGEAHLTKRGILKNGYGDSSTPKPVVLGPYSTSVPSLDIGDLSLVRFLPDERSDVYEFFSDENGGYVIDGRPPLPFPDMRDLHERRLPLEEKLRMRAARFSRIPPSEMDWVFMENERFYPLYLDSSSSKIYLAPESGSPRVSAQNSGLADRILRTLESLNPY